MSQKCFGFKTLYVMVTGETVGTVARWRSGIDGEETRVCAEAGVV